MFGISSSLPQTSFLVQEMNTDSSAEVYHGHDNCRNKLSHLLVETGLPTGLFVLIDEIEECGYVEKTGFVWLKLKKKTTRNSCKFENVHLCYDDVVTAFLERKRIRNLTGVKAKEFLFWFTLSEIHVTDAAGDSCPTITFKNPLGISKSFPLSLFVAVVDEVATKSGIGLAL